MIVIPNRNLKFVQNLSYLGNAITSKPEQTFLYTLKQQRKGRVMPYSLIMLIVFFFVQLFDVPIFMAIGLSVLAVISSGELFPVSTIISGIYASGDNFPLLAVPFFILAGDIMVHGGIATRLVECVNAMVGHKKGGLGMVTVVACMFFASISGSGVATAAAIGGIMIPAMCKNNYPADFAAALTASASAVGPIIPPSIPFIIYGVMCSVSVTDLFIGGIIPGILIGFALIIVVYLVAGKKGYGVEMTQKSSFADKLRAIWKAKFSLLVPVVILGGIYGGIFTPTEAAIVACDLGLIIGFFIYREIEIKDLPGIFASTGRTTGLCLSLLGFALVFGRVLVMERVPQNIANFLLALTDSRILVLLFINILLFITGMLLETSSAVTITSPILLTVAKAYGVDPVHFGVILVTNLCIGLCTPPVGQSLFVATGIAKIPIARTFRPLIPCVIASVIALMIVTYAEPLVMFLPRLLRP
jgi:C4-dicarboxylate transporter DctM subunit